MTADYIIDHVEEIDVDE